MYSYEHNSSWEILLIPGKMLYRNFAAIMVVTTKDSAIKTPHMPELSRTINRVELIEPVCLNMLPWQKAKFGLT